MSGNAGRRDLFVGHPEPRAGGVCITLLEERGSSSRGLPAAISKNGAGDMKPVG
jgi:hypothetical protein